MHEISIPEKCQQSLCVKAPVAGFKNGCWAGRRKEGVGRRYGRRRKSKRLCSHVFDTRQSGGNFGETRTQLKPGNPSYTTEFARKRRRSLNSSLILISGNQTKTLYEFSGIPSSRICLFK